MIWAVRQTKLHLGFEFKMTKFGNQGKMTFWKSYNRSMTLRTEDFNSVCEFCIAKMTKGRACWFNSKRLHVIFQNMLHTPLCQEKGTDIVKSLRVAHYTMVHWYSYCYWLCVTYWKHLVYLFISACFQDFQLGQYVSLPAIFMEAHHNGCCTIGLQSPHLRSIFLNCQMFIIYPVPIIYKNCVQAMNFPGRAIFITALRLNCFSLYLLTVLQIWRLKFRVHF